jgi:aldose 1-epimerase
MKTLLCSLLAVLVAGCGSQPPAAPPATATPAMPHITRAPFGQMPDGTQIDVLTMKNANGIEVRAITYGAIITSIKTPDRNGTIGDIVHGFDSLDGYLAGHPYFGAIVGRYGNRIARGRFTIDGTEFPLATNNGPNHLHGGVKGFDKVVWEAAVMPNNTIAFTRTSPDGEEGYPGALAARVTYQLTEENTLVINYHATTTKPTHVNLTQHSYFNLAGDGDILSHQMLINADRYTPVDATLIPTGELAAVEGTPFDFRKATPIGARIDAADPQLKNGQGYDHNWVLTRVAAGLEPAARVVDPKSGRTLGIGTTEPGMQFYTGNFLDGKLTGKGGRVYGRRSGFCLETQHFPDSPNQKNFPTTLLKPGEEYNSRTVFTFGVQ